MAARRQHLIETLKDHREHLAERPKLLLGAIATLLVEVVVLRFLLPSPLLGFVLGGATVAFAWQRSARTQTGVVPPTTDVLRQLSIDGWTRFDDVIFADAQIDHVAIGPAGVLAIETKWTAAPSSAEAPTRSPHVSWALRQAQRSARKVHLFLASEGVDVQVVPVLLLWGPGAEMAPSSSAVVDGVAVLTGRPDADWLPTLRQPRIDRVRVQGAVSALERYVERFAVSSPGTSPAHR